jgi:hypothetical protein
VIRVRYKKSKAFLALFITDSYAAPMKQQSVLLFHGVASCNKTGSDKKGGRKKSKAFLALFIYGLLCRAHETAICTAVSWCGFLQ